MGFGMKKIAACLWVIGLSLSPSYADPIDDARIIADAQLEPETLRANISSAGEILVGYLKNGFAEEGLTISEEAAAVFFEMFMDSLLEVMIETAREPLAEAYMLNISPDSLAAYSAFLQTPAGQEVIGSQAVMVAEMANILERASMQLAEPAMEVVLDEMAQQNFPDGTLKSTEHELKTLFGLTEGTETDDTL